jgi:hypothetical protein
VSGTVRVLIPTPYRSGDDLCFPMADLKFVDGCYQGMTPAGESCVYICCDESSESSDDSSSDESSEPSASSSIDEPSDPSQSESDYSNPDSSAPPDESSDSTPPDESSLIDLPPDESLDESSGSVVEWSDSSIYDDISDSDDSSWEAS